MKYASKYLAEKHVEYLANWSNKSKAYTPIGVRNLFEKAIENKNGDTEAVFKDKHENKILIELWYASFLALAIKKEFGKEFVLYPSDSPDVHFLDQQKGQGFSVEITELTEYGKDFDGNYANLAKLVHRTKGNTRLPFSHLLIVSMLEEDNFNVTRFHHEVNLYEWFFEKIWFAAYTEKENQWVFFEFFPTYQVGNLNRINLNLDLDKALLY